MLPGTTQIPNRALFRHPEVCEIAQVQPYVLRSWEAEFPDLGVAKTQGAPRMYRRADVERVLRIKHLLFVEGLTLAGARRKMLDESSSPPPEPAALNDLLAADARERILNVRKMLRELFAMLAGAPSGNGDEEFTLAAPRPGKGPAKRTPRAAVRSKSSKRKVR